MIKYAVNNVNKSTTNVNKQPTNVFVLKLLF
jgi:hypothetical protein